MIPKRVVFYSDKGDGEKLFNKNVRGRGICQKILVHLNAHEVEFLAPSPIAGFCSGVDWDKQKHSGMFAIVLFDYNKATVFGILNEVANLNVQVYGVYDGLLYCFSDSQTTLFEEKDIVDIVKL